VQVLVLSNVQSVSDSFPSPFCYNHKNKQQSHNLDNTHHFSLTINKICGLPLTKLILRLSRSVGGTLITQKRWFKYKAH